MGRFLQSEFNKNGTGRLKMALSGRDRTLSRWRPGRLMGEAGLACKTQRQFKAAMNSRHNQPLAPDSLDRPFNVDRPHQVQADAITPIPAPEGWLYSAVVIDLYSRPRVGESMAEPRRAKRVNDALLMAICKRKPEKGLRRPTERGSQQAPESHRALLTNMASGRA
ncbi:transposase (fragment) [Candidatus Methylobacter favarea]|uniref:Transposase n=1 Tax=Candidatus Methylobacter favarea TaxID=2707345 RepID=A0A8S0XLD8_9GAMM